MTFAEWLKKCCPLTLNEVVAKTGMARQTIRDWYSGRYTPTVHAMNRLAGVVGIPLSELLRQMEA